MKPSPRLIRSATLLGLLALLALPAAAAGEDKSSSGGGLKTSKERYSYAAGMQIGAQVMPISENLDIKSFMNGMQDFLQRKPSRLTQDELAQAKTDFQEAVQKDIDKKVAPLAEKNRKKGEEFLKSNGAKKGVTTTASGLQYEVLTAGSGPKPKATDIVKVHYHGTLLDGTVFDSSVQRKEPISIPLGKVIQGWVEGMQLMPVGSKYRLTIPAKLAYGMKGAPPKIEPESTLIFEVELLEILNEKEKGG
nr:Peptidyl-prolyl cis-trans isomerase [uncultured bacterium]